MNYIKWIVDALKDEWSRPAIAFGLTVAIAILFSLFRYKFKRKKERVVTPSKILFVGTFISAVLFFMPIYLAQFSEIQSFLSAVQHSFRLFALDGGYKDLASFDYPSEVIKTRYLTIGAVLYSFAPVLTFGFILSFFKNLWARIKYRLYFLSTSHVFSELNDKTVTLAKDIVKNSKPFLGLFPSCLIVFTDIIDKKEESRLELIEAANEIGAVLFRMDMESVKFKYKWSRRRVRFYLISEDESEKIRHAESIMNRYGHCSNVELRVFSEDVRSELLLATKAEEEIKLAKANEGKRKRTNKIKVVRVNDIQALIYHNLYVNGLNLFKSARAVEGEAKRIISIVIVGLGRYGKEMLRALTWYCQLEGYKLKVNVFDADEHALERFKNEHPELMSDEYNGKELEGEPYYDINIHSGIDVSTPDFEKELQKLDDATYIFVCLGEDRVNLDLSAKIRSMCERISYRGNGDKPAIETVIYDSRLHKTVGINWDELYSYKEKKITSGATNFKHTPYNILMIGDLESFYSEDAVVNSKLVKQARNVHNSYDIEPARIAFTEGFMTEEWNSFIKERGLCKEWERHLCEWKSTNSSAGADEGIWRIAKDKFSFLTDKESAELCEGELEGIKLRRVDEWENLVYRRFGELMRKRRLARKWKALAKETYERGELSFRFEYNYRSSVSKAIHKHLIREKYFGIKAADKRWCDMTLEEKLSLGGMEHVRWNAYMRTEGYSKGARNDMAKRHHNLVPTSKLSNADLRKDA